MNVRYHQLLHFRGGRVSQFPLGLDEYAVRAEKIVSSWKKVKAVSEIDEKELGDVGEAVEMVPEYLPITFNLIGCLNASGRNEQAAMVADSCYKAYHSLYVSLDSIPKFVKDIRNERWGYNGRSEIATAMVRAMTHDLSGSQTLDKAYDTALALIDARIVDGDLLENPSKGELRASEARMNHLRRSMVEELTDGKLRFSPSDDLWQRVGRGGYTLDGLSRSLSYWSDRGMVDNAMIQQLANLIKAEREKMLTGKNINKRSINLFGVKALTLLLYKGRPAMEEYVAEVIGKTENDKLKKYLSTLQENYNRNEALLADRVTVIKSLSSLVPEKDASPDATQLRACRKALGDVFPVKWLFKL